MKPITTVILIAMAAVASAQDTSAPVQLDGQLLLWDRCGGEGDAACMPGDPAFGELPQWQLAVPRCDRTLAPVFDSQQAQYICTDQGGRSSLAVRARLTARLGTQQADQYGRISADMPMNWIPILGTHNSFSNFQDGGNNILNVDQELTITDQLWLGSRSVRLDPLMKSTGQSVILCHMSSIGDSTSALLSAAQYFLGITLPTNESELCATDLGSPVPPVFRGAFSYGRPFYLGVREIRKWLDRNPGEIVVLRINNFFSSDEHGYVNPVDLHAIIVHELGSKLLSPSAFSSYSATYPWPTVRQMRALGKQAIVMLTNDVTLDNKSTWVNPGNNTWNSTDGPKFNQCVDYRYEAPIGLGREADWWEDIGEDRSISNIGNPDGQRGLLTPTDVETAVYCGYSRIFMDFFYALDRAPLVKDPPLINVDYTGGQVAPCGSCDPRPALMIWSWAPAATVQPNQPATLERPPFPILQLPSYLTNPRGIRWTQADENTALPFACAGPGASGVPPRHLQSLDHTWRVSTLTGPWSQGEAACRTLGADYHFWRPMTSPDNQRLMDAMIAAGAMRVWLNHYTGATRVQPANYSYEYAQGGALPSDRLVIATGGFGGSLAAQFQPDAGVPGFINVSQEIPGSPIFKLHANWLSNILPGTYHGRVHVTETHADGSATTAADVDVTLHVSSLVLTLTPSTVDFRSGFTQTIKVNSSASHVAFHPPALAYPGLEIVDRGSDVTPGDFDIRISNLAATANDVDLTLPVAATDPSFGAASLHVVFSKATVVVDTTVPNLLADVDGAPESSTSQVWIVGSVHALNVPLTYSSGGGIYTFTNWSDGEVHAARDYAVNGAAHLTAQYSVAYPLQLTATPAGGGTFLVNGAAPQPTYAGGSNLTITAIAANGYVFSHYAGDAAGQSASVSLVMNGGKAVQGVFDAVSQAKTTLATSPAGLALVVDGVTYTTPVSFGWAAGETHTVQAPTQLSAPLSGTRFVPSFWSDGNTQSTRTIAGSATAATYTANFFIENLLTINVTPSNSGTVTGAGWYRSNQVIAMQATPAGGFAFTGYSGGVNSSSAFANVSMNIPVTVTATFHAASAPVLYGSSSGRTDLGGGVMAVPIIITNLGPGPAGDAVLTGIDGFQVPQGAGGVSVVLPAGGIALGTIAAGSRAQTTVNFVWPVSATRVTFTVHYSANDKTYNGANTITLFR